ncbi:hypothetical protein AB0E21_05250 [Streptomyces sp. NPDC047967]|uniref:hypothetical protein n=1 Tax=Streptomyces sp. NPDC047967 TaxID=3154924 RepID=UPI0033E7AD5E
MITMRCAATEVRWTAAGLLALIRETPVRSHRRIYSSDSLVIDCVEGIFGPYYLVMAGDRELDPDDAPALASLSASLGGPWRDRVIEEEPHFHASSRLYGCAGYTVYVIHPDRPKESPPERNICGCP